MYMYVANVIRDRYLHFVLRKTDFYTSKRNRINATDRRSKKYETQSIYGKNVAKYNLCARLTLLMHIYIFTNIHTHIFTINFKSVTLCVKLSCLG